jgi:hypothetical protein
VTTVVVFPIVGDGTSFIFCPMVAVWLTVVCGFWSRCHASHNIKMDRENTAKMINRWVSI